MLQRAFTETHHELRDTSVYSFLGYAYTTAKVFGFKKYSERKSIWVNCILNTQTMIFYPRMDINRSNLIESNPGQPKDVFAFFITANNKKMKMHNTGYVCYSTQKRGEFLWSPSSSHWKYPYSFAHWYYSGFVCNQKTFLPHSLLQCKRLLWVRRKSPRITHEFRALEADTYRVEEWVPTRFAELMYRFRHIMCG